MALQRIRHEQDDVSIFDRMKWWFVYLVVAGGIFGNWYYGNPDSIFFIPTLWRALILVGMAGGSVALLLTTERGRNLWILFRDARSELRRVIWPTRPETLQTTWIVLILIVIFALILWLLDSGLSLVVRMVIG
ncbi:MAG: preprotein translocase subunit SecE [Gammaproteobacteria bacterium]|nr:preprotein translocase subunit SecE [Gammaproteobacteria bacterium]